MNRRLKEQNRRFSKRAQMMRKFNQLTLADKISVTRGAPLESVFKKAVNAWEKNARYRNAIERNGQK